MKKEFFALAVVGVAACCFGACKQSNDKAEYEALTKKLKASYSQIELTVTDTFPAGDSLQSKYTMSYSSNSITVNYEVEQFVEISLDAPASTGAKTTLTGVVAVVQYDIVSVAGDEVDLDFYAIAHPSYTFDKNYFKNAEWTGNYFTANVDNPKGFMGSKINCKNMKVAVIFNDEVLDKLEISYNSASGSQIKYSYAFTR